MEGYDVEVLKEVSNDLYCVICLKLMRNPVQFKCGHGMCYSCFKYLSNKCKGARYGGEACCPQCREVIKDQYVVSNTMLHRLILSLQVKCSNEVCCWIGEISFLEDHLATCSIGGVQSSASAKTKERFGKNVGENVAVLDRLCIIESKLDHLSHIITPLSTKHTDQTTSDVLQCTKKTMQKKSPNNSKHKEKHNTFNLRHTVRLGLFFVFLIIVLCLASSTSLSSPLSGKCESPEDLNSEILIDKVQFDDFGKWLKTLEQDTSINGAAKFGNCSVDSLLLMWLNIANMKENFKSTNDRIFSLQTNIDATQQVISKLQLFFNSAGSEPTIHPVRWNGDGLCTQLQDSISLIINMKLDDIKSNHKNILQEIVLFYKERNHSLVALDKKLLVHIEQSRDKINHNISLFEEEAVKFGVIKNVHRLQPLLHTTMTYLNGFIFPEIDIHHAQSIELAKFLTFSVRLKLESLLEKVSRLQNIFSAQNNMSHWESNLAGLEQNISRNYRDINQLRFIKVVSGAIETMRIRYDYMLSGYYANISHAISYKERLRGLLLRSIHHNATGMYIWSINTSYILDNHHAYMSETFTTFYNINSTLLLYKDETDQGFWKITFSQQEYKVDMNLTVLVWNQWREEVLMCRPSLAGELLHHDKTVKFYKFFKIPLSWQNLAKNGFIVDNLMLVKIQLTESY